MASYFDKRTDSWYVKFMVKGVQTRKYSLATKAEADAWEVQARSDVAKGKDPDSRDKRLGRASGPSPGTIGPFVAHARRVHWEYKDCKSTPKLTRNAEMFAAYIGPAVPVADALTEMNIRDYLLYMKEERHNSDSTRNKHIASIKVLCNVAKSEGLIDIKPDVKMLASAEGRDRVMSPKEEAALMAYLKQSERQKEHDLVVCLLDLGSRIGETLLLEWQWVDLEAGIVTFPAHITKIKKTRKVPVTDRVAAVLRERQRWANDPTGTVFADINYWGFGNYWRTTRARLKFMHDVRIHDLRHTCATRLAAHGANASLIQAWLGHKSIVTSQRYINLQVDHLKAGADILNRYGQGVSA